jgi:hypothetical protein
MVDIRELTLEELEFIREEVSNYINKISAGSGITNAIPLPGVGDGYDVLMMIKAMRKIARKYGLDEDQIATYPEEIQLAIYELGKKSSTKLIGKKLTEEAVKIVLKKFGKKVVTRNIIKYIPVIGQIASGVISAGLMKIMLEKYHDDAYRTAKRIVERLQAKKFSNEEI